MKLREDDTVRIITGRQEGQLGLIVELTEDRAIVRVEGLPYERSFPIGELEFYAKAKRYKPSMMNDDVTCPSYPYSCQGTCAAAKNQRVYGMIT